MAVPIFFLTPPLYKIMFRTDSEMQTDPTKPIEQGTQVTETAEIETQTAEGGVNSENADQIKVNMDDLAKFVTRAAFIIEDELEAIATSRAFDNIHSYWNDDEEGDGQIKLTYTADLAEPGMSIAHMNWNQTGSHLFVGFHGEHVDWCGHLPDLAAIRLDRGGMTSGKPHQRFNTPACLTRLACHESDPQLVAAGFHTGDILLYRLDRGGEGEIASTSSGGEVRGGGGGLEDNLGRGQLGHSPVVSLLWLGRVSLLAVHTDGILRLWTLDLRKSVLVLTKTFHISSVHLPRGHKPVRKSEVGLRCGVSSEDDPETVLLATETGVLVIGDTATEALSLERELVAGGGDGVGGEVALYDPVVAALPLHTGPINTMAVSSIEGSILATAGEDRKLHVLSLSQPHTPFLTYNTDLQVNSLSWSTVQPGLFAAACKAVVLLFDVLQNKSGPVMKVKVGQRDNIDLPLTVVAFSNKDGGRLSAGDKYGKLYVWKLPPHLTTSSLQQMSAFQSLALQTG